MNTNGSNEEYTERFITAIEKTKTSLEQVYGRKFKGFGEAVYHAERKNHEIITRNYSTLKVLIELRNLLQHTPTKNGEPIATPRISAVEEIEKIAELMVNPPKAFQVMVSNPVTLEPTDSIRKAARNVTTQDLSQIPVYDGDEYVGIFTTNFMARWLSTALDGEEEGELIRENTPVDEILRFSEPHERAEFINPRWPVAKIYNKLNMENPPIVLLVTTDGSTKGQLQGLITRFDMPEIAKKMTV